MVDWTEKYRPSTLQEVRGNDTGELLKWAESWDDDPTAAILHGVPGIGKTSAAHALANDMGWEAVEVNASDSRREEDVERYLGRAARNTTLGGGSGRQLIIVDEADSFHGRADKGGAAALTSLVKDAAQPMVLIANDYYEMSNALRKACKEIEFDQVKPGDVASMLRNICRNEDIDFEPAAISKLAKKNDGDIRSAVNDLQAHAAPGGSLTVDDLVTSGDRDRTTGIFDFLDEVIKEADAETALKSSYGVDETPDDLLDWIEENVPKDYSGDELAVAYDFLANADKWLGRVLATQDYSYWRYATDNMTAGVAAARQGDKSGWTTYGKSSYVQQYWRSSGRRQTRDDIARKIAEHAGVSIGTARREILPFLSTITHHCHNRELTVAMTALYEFDAGDVSFVTGSGEDTNKVQNIVEEAEELREQEAVDHSGGAFDGAVRDATEDDGDGDDGETDGSDDGQSTLLDAGDDGDGDGDDEDEPPKEEVAEDDEDQATLGDWG